MNPIPSLCFVGLAALSLSVLLPCQGLPAPTPAPAFVENLGQWPAAVCFQRVAGGGTCYFTETGFVLAFLPGCARHEPICTMRPGAARSDDALPGVAVSFELVGAHPGAIQGEEALPGRYHFLFGDDPAGWTRDAVGHARIRYVDAWPGIDLVVRQHEGLFEYDLEVEPGADLAAARIRCRGAASTTVQADGSLVFATALGTIRQTPPVAWTTAYGARRAQSVRCTMRDDGCMGFTVEDWDGSRPLVVDPGLLWAAYAGGTSNDQAFGIDVSSTGRIAVGGEGRSAPFPTTVGVLQTGRFGFSDAFVSVYEQDGSVLVFRTLYGRNGFDRIYDLAFDAQQRLVCGGATGSSNLLPTPGAPQTSFGGTTDAFVAVFSADGSNLVFASYHGGNGEEGVQGFHFDAGANVVAIGGWTTSSQMPLSVDAYQTTYGGGTYDGFVAVFDLGSGQRTYSSYFGGSDTDYVSGLQRNGSGLLTLALGTYSTSLPTSGLLPPLQSNYGGPAPVPTSSSGDVFVAQLLPQAGATTLLYGTYFGGPGVEWPFGVDVDAAGVITVAGGGTSTPTSPGAHRSTAANVDGYLARIDPLQPPGQQLVYGTFLGGMGWDNAWRLHVDGAGIATVVGVTESPDLPATVGAFQATFGGGNATSFSFPIDGFVCRVAMTLALPPADQVLYCSYVHGAPTANETVQDAHSGPEGVLSIVGSTEGGLPMPYSAGPNFGGSSDGYLLRLVTPGGFGTFGHGCSTTGAGLVADLGALPLRGTTWQTRVVSMLPAAPGLAAIDLVPQGGIALAPFGLPGCDLYVLPTILQLFVADGSGTGTVALAIPNVVALSGLEVFVQAACQEPAANPVGLAVTHAGMAMIR